jgi:hypothetical protein
MCFAERSTADRPGPTYKNLTSLPLLVCPEFAHTLTFTLTRAFTRLRGVRKKQKMPSAHFDGFCLTHGVTAAALSLTVPAVCISVLACAS